MLTLYCNCFENHEPEHFQYDQRSLMCGSASLSSEKREEYKKKNFYFDDDAKDNISHLNKYLGDLTGLYYVWKNTNHEFVGTNQYRRFWNEEQIKNLSLKENTLYVSAPCVFHNESVSDQFIGVHGVNGLYVLTSASIQKKIDMTLDKILVLRDINYMSTCNMFFAHNKIFDKVCETLFEMVFELYEGCKYTLDFIQKENQTRMLAFLAERILTILYLNKKYYFGNIEIESVRWEYPCQWEQ